MDPRFPIKCLPYLLGAIFLWFLGSKVHSHIFESGARSVQVLWNAEKKQHAEAMEELERKIADREAAHRIENRKITHELAEARRLFEVELARVGAEHDRRLQRSEERAEVYRRQAQGGASERGDLAEHAARLDSSLEEGRSLVRELRETLGLRERELRAISQQLLNDRHLFETPADE